MAQSGSRGGVVLALLDVFTVYAAGSIMGFLIAKLVGAPLVNPLESLARTPDQDLLPLTWQLLQVLFWQYLGWAICGAAIVLLRRAKPEARQRAERGAGFSAVRLILLGLAAGVLVTFPAHAIHWAQERFDLGETVAWRQALFDRQWGLDFWIFLAVGSFAVIPVVEEAFYRGFVLSRLTESLRPLDAAIFTTALFAFSHSQYLHLDVLNVLTLTSVLWSGFLFALVTLYSRSLAPAIIAHALINVPIRAEFYVYSAPLLAVAALILLFELKGFRNYAVGVFRAASGYWFVFALVGAGLAAAYAWQSELVALAALPVWGFLCIFYLVRRLARPKARTEF